MAFESKVNGSRKWEARQVVTALGILLLTFGLFGWQWRAFSQRNSAEVAENETAELSEERPPANTHWHEASPRVRQRVADCIRGQLDAFRAGQYEAGLQFHTRFVRRSMTSAENYKQLMQTSYPLLSTNRSAVFRFVNTDKERHFANAGVSIISTDGRVMEAVYQLVNQDRNWLISSIAKRPPLSRSTPQKP